MVVKINDVKSYDGFERHVEGIVYLDNDAAYEFVLDTYDGFTSIHLIDGDVEVNLEDEDDLKLFNIDEEVGIEIYDEILDFVNDNGYGFIGEEFE